MKLVGTLHFYFETGTEGGFWAFEEEGRQGGYDGLHLLQTGDSLVIYDIVDREKVVWQGEIELDFFPSFEIPIGGMWVHSLQVGVKRELWGSWFFSENPAILETD